jgi:F-type H+-transporting ATPase subunit gamma
MARNLRELRHKIKGVKSTRQVTKAMELVSASKMRRAIQSAMQLRKYSRTAWSILERVALASSSEHPALGTRPLKNVFIVLFTSDRGLAGNFNTQMTRLVAKYLKGLEELGTFQSASFVAIGKKGQQFLTRTGQKIVAAFPAMSVRPQFRDILPITRLALDSFQSGEYDHVVVLYPDFVSPLVQQATAKVLLPISRDNVREMTERLVPRDSEAEKERRVTYTFEPSAEEVLDRILPQITEMQMYQALLESTASEHSARMVAMRNASDNASDLIGDLTLTYNQSRQAGITNELAELSAAAAALG